MANELREGENLTPVDYSSLLKQILNELPTMNPFKVSSNKKILEINIDDIAACIAKTKVENPISNTISVRSATVNFASEKSFSEKIQEIKGCLETHFSSALQGENLVDFIEGLTTNLESFQGQANKLGLSYPFNEEYKGLQTKELILDSNKNGSDSILRFAKLTITVENTKKFISQLETGIKNHISDSFETDNQGEMEGALDILNSQINEESSDFNLLQKLVDQETLGKLKREAIITYLKYIEQNVDSKDKNTKGFIYLQDLIRRLKLIEEYLDEQTDDFEVYYAGVTVNYKDAFARGEAFDALPIIPIIEGNLGESRDKEVGKVQFTLGLKLKLNGKVQKDRGKTSFEYNLDIINPENSEHKAKLADPDIQSRESFAKKVLIRVFLYYFIFACDPPSLMNDELLYNPRLKFEQVLIDLKSSKHDDEKRKNFRGIVKGFSEYRVQEKVNSLCQFLINFINKKKRLPVYHENHVISISREILNKDLDSISIGNFFQEDWREGKKILKYIFIDKPGVNSYTLCQIPVIIKIEDIRYFQGDSNPKGFKFEYDIQGMKTLPMFWIPNTNPCLDNYKAYFEKEYKHILFYYDNKRLNQDRQNQEHFNSTQIFLYRFTWILLSYLCLYILLEECSEETKELLFIPMVRLHEGTPANPFHTEKFLADLSKLLCHIFNQKYRCNSQGFRVEMNKKPKPFKIRNGLNSLYSVLSKKFTLTDTSNFLNLEKLAIIIVSSRESDAKKNNKNSNDRIITLIGEVIGIEKLEDGSVKIQPLITFDNNYYLRKMYEKPPILNETVKDLYAQGYQNFLYVAQATYTSTLHITQQEQDEKLYFMSPTIIKDMKQGQQNIKIYPVFYDKYYVHPFKSLDSHSFYIQDTKQLMNIAEDSSQEAVVFFNLFNGILVGNNERFYNGVISYSTLLGKFYPGVMDDADIREALVLDSQLKNDILQYLTFFHFSRFERQTRVSLKLDPYENIIGDKSVGALSIFPHLTENINFNALAFLIEVNKVIDVYF
ncbi:MAG: hypothetical protein O4861_02870 [Trichodesmium sp. St16_bin4-tuft]|nr:hypothetical protein [Trichodesmium sp. St16_bin4-tuft]MDE5101885.1 hypothetical protein [Trichodesmium sp. St19_bin2]